MIIRDLTLRSAASFGSFHLIRLLYDEYVFYLVEQKVAQVLGKSPVAVMGLQQFRASMTKNLQTFSYFSSNHRSTTKNSLVLLWLDEKTKKFETRNFCDLS